MTPVLLLKFNPAGRLGFTLYELTVPPLLVGTFAVAGVPTWYTAIGVLYVKPVGGEVGVLPPLQAQIEIQNAIRTA